MSKTAWAALFVLSALALPDIAWAQSAIIDQVGSAAMGGTMSIARWLFTIGLVFVGLCCLWAHQLMLSAVMFFVALVVVFAGPGMLKAIPGWASLGTTF
jgi:hypothetical protein